MTSKTTARPSLKEVKAILGTDFLSRDGDTFVYQKDGRTVNWEKSLPSGSAYSSELLALDGMYGVRNEESVIANAYGMAQRLLDTLDIGGNVILRLRSDDESFTDSKVVNVSSKVFDDRDIDIAHRLDIFLGTAEHEGLHCEFTDFSVHGADQIMQSLLNIVEDERIEHMAGEKYPGLANYLKGFKYYYFCKWRERHRRELDSRDYGTRLINTVIALIRYPKALTDSELDDFGKYLVQIHEVMKDFPSSTSEALVTAQRIFDIIKDAVENSPSESGKASGKTSSSAEDKESGKHEEHKDESRSGENEQPGGKEAKETKETEDERQERKDSGTADEADEESSEGTAVPGDEDEEDEDESRPRKGAPCDGSSDGDADGGNDGSASDDGEDEGTDEEGPCIKMTPEELSDALKTIGKILAGFTEENDSSSQASALVKGNPDIDYICRGERERGDDENVIFLKVQPTGQDEAVYREDLDAVRRYVPAMRNILVAQSSTFAYDLRGMRSGRLDGSRLSQAYIGSPNVYRQRREVKSDRVAVCVLVDESGSMCGNKITAARRTAILLDKALSDLPNVDFFMYGHTADEDDYADFTDIDTSAKVTLRIYKDRTSHNASALGNMTDRLNNADGHAILETAKRVRRQTGEKVLFFIISDGAPAYSGYNRAGVSGKLHTRKCVQEVEKMGFIPIQIAIDPECDPAEMFRRHVRLEDMSLLPTQLGSLIRKAVLENTERH